MYAAELYERRNSGVRVPSYPFPPEITDWRPDPNECHKNADKVAELDPRLKVVNGWLFFDWGWSYPYVRFTAHSVNEKPDGSLVDFTPTSVAYPFIRAELPDAMFDAVVRALFAAHGGSHLDHLYRT